MSEQAKPCRLCGVMIRFVKTTAGKPTPVDDAETTTMVVSPDGRVLAGFVSHFSSCKTYLEQGRRAFLRPDQGGA